MQQISTAQQPEMIINSCQNDVEALCVALVTYKLTKIYENNDQVQNK